MSFWTYIDGVITVSPMGRTQPEKRYILDTVLEHLPKVQGSEKNMTVKVIQKPGYNSSCSHDEFWQRSNLGNGRYGTFETQDKYLLMLNGDLRDRKFDETYREFVKWLCRLAKRVNVDSVLVRIVGYGKECVINEYGYENPFQRMNKDPSWCKNGSENWCEYLMWDEEDL